MTKPNWLDEMSALEKAATHPEAWYKYFHQGGDCYGPLDSLRGPYFSWLLFHERFQNPPGALADTKDDAAFIAASRQFVPKALECILELSKVLRYCSKEDPLAVTPDQEYDFSSMNDWKQMKSREVLAKWGLE